MFVDAPTPPAGLSPYRQRAALLNSTLMGGISSWGSTAELSARIYDVRDFMISTFNLNPQGVYSVLEPVGEFHIRPCDICNINDFDTENQLFLCDGCNGCFHMQCSGLDWVLQADWLCKTCIADGLSLIDGVLAGQADKKRRC